MVKIEKPKRTTAAQELLLEEGSSGRGGEKSPRKGGDKEKPSMISSRSTVGRETGFSVHHSEY